MSAKMEFDLLIVTFFVTVIFSSIYTSFKFFPSKQKDTPKIEPENKSIEKKEPKIAGKRIPQKTPASLHKKREKLSKEKNLEKTPNQISRQDQTLHFSTQSLESSNHPKLSPTNSKVEVYRSHLKSFLTGILKGADLDHRNLDNFNKFGLNLFLAGASEVADRTKVVDSEIKVLVLAELVNLIGFKKSHSEVFASKYAEYLMQDPRYMQMFQAGRTSMSSFKDDQKEAVTHFKTAITEWNKPKRKEEHSGPITVLFTDIEGSTQMTQMLGDEKVQTLLRVHNRIIREALTQHSGKEIKHTGDGIMASFVRTTNSVDAAIQMQRTAAAYNQQNPKLPLHIKIGLNAGEPIVEDNDLFGSTVQMSARIVDKAKADQIFVSENIRSICAGKNIPFINKGVFKMKGFSEEPILYEIDWQVGL